MNDFFLKANTHSSIITARDVQYSFKDCDYININIFVDKDTHFYWTSRCV